MTNQETFDKVCEHLKKQGGPATEYKYRCADGTKCAIGGIISDDDYDPAFDADDECDIVFAATENPEILDAIGNHDIDFLEELQVAHDHADDYLNLMERMENVAIRYNIDPSAAQ